MVCKNGNVPLPFYLRSVACQAVSHKSRPLFMSLHHWYQYCTMSVGSVICKNLRVAAQESGYCLVGKIPPPNTGVGVGGYRDGWVGWPQISAFWATIPPPPPGCGCAFWEFWVCAGL